MAGQATPDVLDLSEIEEAHAALTGPKALSLARLMCARLPLPRGVVELL